MTTTLHTDEPTGEASGVIRAYRRDLPGGGFVALDVSPVHTGVFRPRTYAGSVVVERRSAARPGDSASPVIARAAGRTVAEVIEALLPAARCNATIAAAFLRLSRERSERMSEAARL